MGRNKKKNELIQGLFLETGIQYNTPLYFRKVYSMDNNEKLFTRKLHMWNDLSVFTHIGYAPFFIHAGYRWNDFVKSNSPSFSSFNLGVGFDVNFAFNNR